MHLTNITNIIFFLLLMLLRFATGVSGRSHKGGGASVDDTQFTTNAARMRVGLPPLKPRKLYIPTPVGARAESYPSPSAAYPNLYRPTQVKARASYPSPSNYVRRASYPLLLNVHPNAVTGYIQVNRANDGNLPEGYVSGAVDTTGLLGLTPHDDDSRMSITFAPANPFNIAINDPKGSYPFLGFAGDDLDGNVSNYMVETNPTSSGSRPLPVGNGLDLTIPDSASAIWSFDSQSHRLTPQWINSDGRFISTHLWFYPSLNALAIVANPAEQPSGSYEVYFTVVLS
ncbi:hypothetical protein BYT27DRAFT_7245800 [Phlegmacium glaucopus]|nr:hypothetical protein BYT27DRAFT_7245800 [Phlegmacium glaucopus]